MATAEMALELEEILLKVRVPWEIEGVMSILDEEMSTPYLLLSKVRRLIWF